MIAFISVAIFIGFNLNHAQTQRELQSGRVDPRDAPKSSTDLQVPSVLKIDQAPTQNARRKAGIRSSTEAQGEGDTSPGRNSLLR